MLVITILVIVVLAGAVILTVSKNNPLSNANEAVYKSDLKSFMADLNLKVAEELGKGNNAREINADRLDLAKYIPSIKGKTEYEGILEISEGKLYLLTDYIADEEQDKIVEWAAYVGIEARGKPMKPIINKLALEAGTDRIKASIEVTDSKNGIVGYVYEISEDSNFGEIKEKKKEISKECIFTGLKKNRKYYVRVVAEDRKGNNSDEKIEEATTGDVNIEEGDITFIVRPNLGEGVYTNKNITVEIKYPEIEGLRGQYSLDGNTWNDYVEIITLSSNKTVYTRMIDEGGNETDKHPSIQINKIDKVVPERFTPVVSDVNTNSLKIKGSTTDGEATVDNGESGIGGYQYRVDGGVWTSEVTTTEYTFSGLDNKVIHSLSMRAIDKAGNIGVEEIVSKQIGAINDAITFVLNPNLGEGSYTNKNVTVSISYPEVAGTTKKVSYDGRVWSNYVSALSIDVNKTVYAKLVDDVGNESKAKTVMINKIDKVAPGVPSVNLNGYTAGAWSRGNITVTYIGIDGVSNINNASSGIAKYQYTTNGGSSWVDLGASYILSSDTVGINLQIRSVDKAGNVSSATGIYNLKKDVTVPSISNATGSSITDKSMKVTVAASDVTSKIRGYKLSKDNGATYTAEQASNVFSITGLVASTKYNIKVQVIDNAGNVATSGTYAITTAAPPGQILASVAALGDYVNYTANGYTQWRVLTKNASTGEVTIISAGSVEIYSTANWKSCASLFNQICYKYYNSSYAKGNTVPNIRSVGTDLNGNLMEEDRTPKLPDIALMEAAGVKTAIPNISYWLGFRDATWSSSEDSGVTWKYYIATIDKNTSKIYWSNVTANNQTAGIRPVITLKTNIRTTGKNASGVWQLITQ